MTPLVWRSAVDYTFRLLSVITPGQDLSRPVSEPNTERFLSPDSEATLGTILNRRTYNDILPKHLAFIDI